MYTHTHIQMFPHYIFLNTHLAQQQRAAEREVFREAAARLERAKLRHAMEKFHQDEAKIRRERESMSGA
jgi:hypothetical protein